MSWTGLCNDKNLSDETMESKEIHLQDGKNDHGVEFIVSGLGSISVTPYTSISGRDWISNGSKVSGFGATSGPDSDGKQILSLLLKPSEFLKFSIAVVGVVSLSLWFTQK